MSHDETVLRAEILWALKCVKANFSFKSNNENNELFMTMFPDSVIAQSYKMSETKCKYLIQFGIYPYILEEFKEDIKKSPFSFLFDETTTVQVKKQLDGYIRYESKQHSQILTRYCGSVFHGHCLATDIKSDFVEFGKMMSWDVQYLLQIGM